MNDWSKVSSDTIPPLDMTAVEKATMTVATGRSIDALAHTNDLDETYWATARLALEVAERIDADGPGCAVSLYNRLHSLLLDLQGRSYRAQFPVVSAAATDGQEANGCTL